MFEQLCHQCHIRDYANIAAELNPECLNIVMEDCSACDSLMAVFKTQIHEIINNNNFEIINNNFEIINDNLEVISTILQTGFIVCQCKNVLIFAGNPFKCNECNKAYLKTCENIGMFLSSLRNEKINYDFQVIDLDELMGERHLAKCLNLHEERLTKL